MAQDWRAVGGPATQHHRRMMGSDQVPDQATAQTDRRRRMMDWGSAQGFAGGDPAIHHHHLMMGSGPVALAPVAWG